MSKPLIKITNIKRDFVLGNEIVYVLKGIDLEIKKGEYVALMGPSGSGKSTLMNLLGCLDTPTSGTYILNGKDVDTDELNEELEDLNCAREDYPGGISGIGPEELDLIIDLCNGREIPTDRRLSLLRAIHHIRDTQIERSILESINGSDSRISKFLDEAEQMGGAAPDSD